MQINLKTRKAKKKDNRKGYPSFVDGACFNESRTVFDLFRTSQVKAKPNTWLELYD